MSNFRKKEYYYEKKPSNNPPPSSTKILSTQAVSFKPTNLMYEPPNLQKEPQFPVMEEEIKKILQKYKNKLKNQPSDKKEILLEEDGKKVSLMLDKNDLINLKYIFVAQSEKSTADNPTYCFHLLYNEGKIKAISIKFCFDNLQKKQIYQQNEKNKRSNKYPEEHKIVENDFKNIKFHENLIENLKNDIQKENDFGVNPEKMNFLKEKLSISLEQLNVYKKSENDLHERYSRKKVNTYLEIEYNRLKSGLPVYAKKFDIINYVKKNKISLIYGETGCGKSTQIPQYLAEIKEDFFGDNPIVVTEPRKIAVKTLAEKVAKEQKIKSNTMNSTIIYQVGSIKPKFYEKNIDLLYMLDRTLLDEYAEDRNLSKYGCIIVDEAHERNVNTDVLLGFLFQLSFKRTDNFRLVIMSATMDNDLFEKYFKTPIYKIPGKIHPITIKYYLSKDKSSALETIENLIKTELFTRNRKLKPEYDGHILIFTSGLDDIKVLYRKLLGWFDRKFYYLFQMHGKISYEQQQAIYEEYDSNIRKIILATRMAESSITINNVKIVIDIGYDLQQVYDKTKKITKTEIRQITQSQSIQRKGRAGRTTSGYCFRIYSEEDYEKMQKFKESEILNINSDLVVLKLKQLGVKDVISFDYLEPPPTDSLVAALLFMEEIGAFDEKNENLSKLGELMAKLPTEPALSRIIIEGKHQGCYEEIIKIVAVMTYGNNMFYRKASDKETQEKIDLQKTEFYDKSSDLIIFLNIYDTWMKNGDAWCESNGINNKSLQLAKELKEEIDSVLTNHKSHIQLYLESQDKINLKEDMRKRIIKCFLSSMYDNICIYTKNPKIGYMLLGRNMIIKLDESSTFSMQAMYPKWLIASEFIQGDSQYYARMVSEIDIDMIQSMVPGTFLKRYNLESLDLMECPIYKKKRFEDIPSRLISAFFNKKTAQIQKFFLEYENDYFDFSPEKNFMEIWTLKDISVIENSIKNIMDTLLEVSKKESLEYKWIGDTRLIIEKGAQVKRILFQGEFRNMIFSSLNITNDSFKSLMQENAISVLTYNLNENNHMIEGVVTTETPEECEKVEKLLKSLLKIKKTMNITTETKVLRYQLRIVWFVGKKTGAALFGFNAEDEKSGIDLALNFFTNIIKIPNYYIYNKSYQNFIVNQFTHKPHVILNGIHPDLEDNELDETFHHIFDAAQIFPEYAHLIREKQLEPFEDLDSKIWMDLIKEKFDLVKNEEICVSFKSEGKYQKEMNIEFLNHEDFIAFKQQNNKENCALNLKNKIIRLQLKFMYKLEIQIAYQIFACLIDKISDLQSKIIIHTEKTVSLLYYYYQIEEALKDMRATISLLVEGSEMEYVKWAVEELKFLLQGVVFPEKDKRKLSYFLSEEGIQLIKQITEKEQVFIEYNSEKNIAKLYGEEKKIKEVQNILADVFTKITSQYKIISLKGKNILSLIINRMAKWNEIYENFSDKLEIIPKFSQKEIRVKGSPELVLAFEKELESHISNNLIDIELKPSETCGICYGEITECFLLEHCRHKFCQICLSEMIDSASLDLALLPLKCLTCGTPISLQDLKEIASPNVLNIIYKRSLENYMQQNKEKYKFCPAPDCGQVLKLDKNMVINAYNKNRPKTLVCDTCKRRFCSNCFKPDHPGSNCDSDLDVDLMKKFNMRACPKCKLIIQKTEGCNHMHCKPPHGCDSHLCWHCGESFKTSGECYNHMNQKEHYNLNEAIRNLEARDRGVQNNNANQGMMGLGGHNRNFINMNDMLNDFELDEIMDDLAHRF